MCKISRAHIFVTGRVQGVGFRYFVVRNAKELALVGWVRNCTDGTVEVVAEGNAESLQQLIDRLKSGPPMAWVRNVSAHWQSAKGDLVDFVIKPTAYT